MGAETRDLIVIGGGPAGLTAALYAARGGLATAVLEPGLPGGQVANVHRIENYPGFPDGVSGPELAERLERQARTHGAEILAAGVEAVRLEERRKVVLTAAGEFAARCLIVATGALPRQLGVPGEQRYRGRGVSYCATCDGAFFRGRDVVVVGGGNAAVEEALFLTRFARRVTIVHRRDRLRAAEVARRRAQASPQIAFRWNAVVTAIEGDDDRVHGVRLRTPEGETFLPADGVFIYIGADPVTGFLGNALELVEGGYLKAGEDTATSFPGVFAAGDVRAKTLRQVVTAAADGAVAAAAAERYLAAGE